MGEGRACHFCGLRIRSDEPAIEAMTRNGWAHVTCWYAGGPFERESLLRGERRPEGEDDG
jgi:hypothetical protein